MSDERDKLFKEHEMAVLLMFELVIDVLIRMGVAKEEFEAQFMHNLERLRGYPHAEEITKGLRRMMRTRSTESPKIRLRDTPPQRA